MILSLSLNVNTNQFIILERLKKIKDENNAIILNDFVKNKTTSLNDFIIFFEEIINKVNKKLDLTVEEYKVLDLFKTKKLLHKGRNDKYRRIKFFVCIILTIIPIEKNQEGKVNNELSLIFDEFIDNLISKAKKPKGYKSKNIENGKVRVFTELTKSELEILGIL